MTPALGQTAEHLPTRNLDFLRALAVVCVFGDHLISSSYPTIRVISFFNILGRIGVLFFFIHTSYVLMHSLERLTQKVSTIKSFIIFYIRRIFRIYPLAMVTVVALALFGTAYAILGIRTAGVFWSNFFLIETLVHEPHVIAVFWTLPIEVEMYLLLPFCFLAAKKSPYLAFFILLLSLWFGIHMIPTGGEKWSVAFFAPCFIASVLAYSLAAHSVFKAKFSGRYWVPTLITTSLVLGILFQPSSDHSVICGWFFTLPLACLIPLFRDIKASFFTRMTSTVAKYSYGIYLMHIPAIKLSHGSWPEAILYTAILAALAYHLVEAPAIRIGQRISDTISKEKPNVLEPVLVP